MKKLEAFLVASKSKQNAILDCYCGDDLPLTDPLVARARSVAMFCSAKIKDKDIKQMSRGILAFDLNSWGVTNPGTKSLAELKIYDVGSKINHSCKANTATDGAGTHRALKRIPVGTQITTDYLGQSIPKATNLRRYELWRDKRFWCKCELCELSCDTRRCLQCPYCRHGTILPTGTLISVQSFPKEQKVKINPSIPPLPSDILKSPSNEIVWKCETCDEKHIENNSKTIFRNVKDVLTKIGVKEMSQLESHIEREIETLWLQGTNGTNTKKWKELLETCSRCLGTKHWLEKWCLHAYLMSMLQRKQIKKGFQHQS